MEGHIGNGDAACGRWPADVGIIAMEVYIPSQYVDQEELEQFDGVSKGKYTIGLGQARMGFCSDREDINSLCLTVVQNLMERHDIDYKNVGRLEVGTETIIDKSKSTKTVLMQLFETSGNTDIEGVDSKNACYGGTASLFNAVNWIESSYFDGRYALVVAADIAVYATGNARCTGGAGAIAMLIGANAPLIFDRGLRAIHMQHAYDFYKPDMASEYPVVDGKLSIKCYLGALDKCYQLYAKKYLSHAGKSSSISNFNIDSADAFLFHSPYCKLVQKSFARLMLNDFLQDGDPDFSGKYAGLKEYRKVKLEDTYFNKDVEKAFLVASKSAYIQKVEPGLHMANQLGNMYAPSLYGCLISCLNSWSLSEAAGKRLVLFSYGSGLASSMFSMHVTNDVAPGSNLDKLKSGFSDIDTRLNSRTKVSPQEFADTMKLREDTHHIAPYTPVGDIHNLLPATWYLTNVDDKHRKTYDRKPILSVST
ncbi:hydroxymethylglutaryl-CoA synthase 1-like [Tubulanus polymorphus]|uniref:hydroxymethylglutaryl-CoA synthase 1-like n=1 Tax=Tubulanus polymorphus TaxID=672921 RepID=UPI003DA28BD1